MKTLVRIDDSYLEKIVGGAEIIVLPGQVPDDKLQNNPLAAFLVPLDTTILVTPN